jgi:hypothetical protein
VAKVNRRQLKRLDELANLWNKSRDEKYREEWYRLIKTVAAQVAPQVSASALASQIHRKRT